jgi:hypothetical protein
MLWKQNVLCCAVCRLCLYSVNSKTSEAYRLPQYMWEWRISQQWHWQCASMVLGEWFAVLGRIVVPSSLGSRVVWLDPEDEGTSHTATQCLIPKGLNLPTNTVGNLDSPFSVHFTVLCYISNREQHCGLCWHSICNKNLVFFASCTGMARSCDQVVYEKRFVINI